MSLCLIFHINVGCYINNSAKIKSLKLLLILLIIIIISTTRILEMLGRFLYMNKMKTKRLSNHMSQYFIHNRT